MGGVVKIKNKFGGVNLARGVSRLTCAIISDGFIAMHWQTLCMLLIPYSNFLEGGEFLFRAVEGQEFQTSIFLQLESSPSRLKDAQDLHACGAILLLPWAFADIGDAFIVEP